MPTSQFATALKSLLFIVALATSARGAEPDPAQPAPPVKKVLIIGIDGCRPDALLAAKAPHLQGQIAAGAFSDQTQTGKDTVSGPGWSSMLTGVWADKHGVRNNEFKNSNYEKYPHFFRRLKDSKPGLNLQSIVHWAPIHEKIMSGADLSVAVPTDALVAAGAVKVLSQKNPDVLFLHFDDVDSAGHAKGFHPTVPEYIQAIEKTDEYVGTVLAAVKARPTYAQEDWLILSSTDHGGKGTGHSGGANVPEIRTIYLIASGPSTIHGKIEQPTFVVDVAATAIAHLGVPILEAWELDGKPVGLKQP